MHIADWQGMTLGLREGIIALIALVAIYMLVVLWRMRRLRQTAAPLPVVEQPARLAEESAPAAAEAPQDDPEVDPEVDPEPVPDRMAEQILRLGLEQELAQLRDEVDAMRGELAALRDDMQHELGQMRASQTVSPIYGDAMQLAVAGYDAGAIAERCGIARAEADLVVALAKRQQS